MTESEKYKKLLDFVKKCAFDYHDWDNTNHMSFDATDVLREIGEFNAQKFCRENRRDK